jgi:NADPH:quinone reductase-like Zn-dependent oxidoreductase
VDRLQLITHPENQASQRVALKARFRREGILRSWRELKGVLKPDGLLVQAGAPKGGRVLGPLKQIAAVRLASLGSKQKVLWFTAKVSREDLTTLGELVASGRVKPFVEQRFELSETADALRLLGEGHVQGKLVLAV